MKIRTIKTAKIKPFSTNKIETILDKYLLNVEEKSILAVTSKIVSLTEGRIVKIKQADRQKLIIEESNYYLSPHGNDFHVILSIKDQLLVPKAGIDVSNSDGHFVLWPKDRQASANKIRQYLQKRFKLRHIGVIICDSRVNPLRWGTTGMCIAHSGFRALNDYRDKQDIFGHKNLRLTKANVADGLAAAATLAIGEGDEQTPLAVIEDVSFVRFQDKNPTKKELKDLRISLKDDLYAPILKSKEWKKV